jgi:hypothetical protein
MNIEEYYRDHYGQLQGLTVLSVAFPEDEGELWPSLLMARDNGKGGIVEGSHVRVTLSRDPEGNGAGHAFIEPLEI